jgi:hypothetical protein
MRAHLCYIEFSLRAKHVPDEAAFASPFKCENQLEDIVVQTERNRLYRQSIVNEKKSISKLVNRRACNKSKEDDHKNCWV